MQMMQCTLWCKLIEIQAEHHNNRNRYVLQSRGLRPFVVKSVFMAARQLAGWRPLYFTADVSIILLTYFIFFICHLISEVSGPIVTKLCHMFGGDCSFLNWVKNMGSLPQKIWGPKNIKISDFALWSRISPDRNKISSIGKRHWKLQLLPYVSTKFVYKRRKIGPWIRPTQSTFSDAHVSAHISGAKGFCPLKIS